MQAHAHADAGVFRPRVRAQRPLSFGGGFGGGARAWEDVEERVTLRIDLLAVVAGERLTQDSAMLDQHVAVAIAQDS